MHPCDHAYAVVVIFGGADVLYAQFRSFHCGKQLDFYGILQLFTEKVHHFLRIGRNLF